MAHAGSNPGRANGSETRAAPFFGRAAPAVRLTILGLGPGPAAYLTTEAREVLRETQVVWLRTARHPAVAALRGHLELHSFDELFERAPTLSEVYATIAERLLALARANANVVYAVPGHPTIGEESVRHVLREARAAGVAVRVVAGLSFVEPVCAALELDPLAEGLQIVDATRLVASYAPPLRRGRGDDPQRWAWLLNLARPPFDPTRPLLVAQVTGRRVARLLRRVLLTRYPPEHALRLIYPARRPGKEAAREVPLDLLGRMPDGVGAATLYVPPLAPLDAVDDFTGLRTVVARLRGPGGCPWDREQTHETLKQYLVEETYEVLEALEKRRPQVLAEELGDLLLQIVLHAQLAAETGHFALENVFRAITTKLIRRHPHVFGSISVADAAEVVRNWEQIKQGEEGSTGRSLLDSVPRHLPALAYAQAIQRKVARCGFDWPALDGVLDKVAEEVAELRQAPDDALRRREAGDVLFAVVNALRWLKIDAEEALRQANRRFGSRFQHVERLAIDRGLELARLSLAELDALWEEAKGAERAASPIEAAD